MNEKKMNKQQNKANSKSKTNARGGKCNKAQNEENCK